MWLQATFTLEDLRAFADQALPLRIMFGKDDEHRIHIGKPRELTLIEGEGLAVTTHARIHWPVLGISIPITVPSVGFVLTPHIARVDGHDVLGFRAFVTRLDVSHVPGLVERSLIGLLNDELAKKGDVVAWNFIKTLDFEIPLPVVVAPARRIRLAAAWGEVKVTSEGFTLLVSFGGLVTKSAYNRRETASALASKASDKPRAASHA